MIVCDGGRAIEKAVKNTFESTKIQRCFVHLLRYVRNRASIHPNTPARKAILKITKELFKVKTLEEATKWNETFDRLYKHYEKQINAFHYSDNPDIKKNIGMIDSFIILGIILNMQKTMLFYGLIYILRKA